MSLTNFKKVDQFNKTFGVTTHNTLQNDVFDKDPKLVQLRLDLITEEVQELKDAIKQKDMKETIDALSDILYVVYGAGSSFGINLDVAFDMVHESNMSKLCRNEDVAKMTVEWYKKEYEVARLYLKLEEYESAIIYFRSVLNNFYDIDFADEARIGIIFTHILNDNRNGARRYLETEKDRFLQSEKYETAVSLFEETEFGLKLHHYYQLYK